MIRNTINRFFLFLSAFVLTVALFVPTAFTQEEAEYCGADASLLCSLSFPGIFYAQLLGKIKSHSIYLESDVDKKIFDECVAKIIGEDSKDYAVKGKLIISSCLGDDRYANFRTHEELKEYQEENSGEISGIGIGLIQVIDIGSGMGTKILIHSIVPDSPAEKSGLLSSGDIILAVGENNGSMRSLAGVSIEEAKRLIRGKAGTNVTLKIERNSKDIGNVGITRGRLNLAEITYRLYRESDIAYIKFSMFADDIVKEKITSALKDAKKAGVKNVILDLRDNPGGSLFEAMKLVELFISDISKPYITGLYRNIKTSVRAGAKGPFSKMRIVILINGGSASASEVVAGALRLQGGAVLIGEKTYGKGLVQEIYHLVGGNGLTLTVARYYFSDGSTSDGKGIQPDIFVKNVQSAADAQLEKAIEYLKKK